MNIKPGEFGQQLGNWLIYVDNVKDREYQNLVLFSKNGLEFESFILANKGNAKNAFGVFEMDLHNGIAYIADSDNFKKIIFENMIVRSKLGEPRLRSYDLFDYWSKAFDGSSKKLSQLFSQSILISLFPLFSIALLPLFGIANPRFHRNFSYLYIIVSILIFYTFTYIISNNIPLIGIIPFLFAWSVVSYLLYKRFILRYY